MRGIFRRGTVAALLVLTSIASFAAEEAKEGLEREYQFSLLAVRTALQQLGAYNGNRLPGLDGFIKSDRAQLERYERPYYEFKIDLAPVGADRTTVRVKAKVSAWYADPQGEQTGYQAFESSGRLENDLLDRLNDFLTKNRSTIAGDPEALAKKIAQVRQEREDEERRVSQLEKRLQILQAAKTQSIRTDYVSAIRSGVPILAAPQEPASVLLRVQSEDEFEVLEHRGAWLRVGLESTSSGWVKMSQVKPSPPVPVNGPSAPVTAEGFTVIRENSATFSGDWSRLNGKPALYVFARPEGSVIERAAGRKLRFAEAIFKERYLQASHSSQNSAEGVVVIFMDERGGVAAATLDDIAHWADGSLSQAAFLKRCSLDPPGAFENAGATRKPSAP